mmetsp:Transcript_20116/g.46475  ORF Transcript_20116/g.46475 Transcript_20116/m.46475 type:complete len:155 (-) Transcript_20116:38-502(-)
MAQRNSVVQQAAPAQGGHALFDGAHNFMKDISEEVEDIKRLIATEDEKRRVEIEELRRDQEQERFERRDALNKLRYEFEDFVRRKIDKVLEEVSEMKRVGRSDDAAHEQQINHLIADFDRLKENLFCVQSAWGKLVSNCVTPQQQDELQKRGSP